MPPFLRSRPPIYGSCCADSPSLHPHILARLKFFQKSPCVFVFLRLIWSFLQRNDGFPTYLPMPPQKRQKRPFDPILCRFLAKWGGIAGMWGNRHFSAGTSRADAELQFHMGFFEKTSVGLRYGGVCVGLLG